jgi:hypothetical protein
MMPASPADEPAHKRDSALDLIKWLALATMFIDHLRYAIPELELTYIPGRLAFPFFCVAIAANVARQRHRDAPASWRYLAWMLAFSVLSEWPYRLLVPDAQTLNIMPTLALGLLITQAIARPKGVTLVLGLLALAIGLYLDGDLQYGVPGMLLIAGCYAAMRRPAQLWLLPVLLSLVANYWPEVYESASHGDISAWLVIAVCGLPPLLGIWLLGRPIPFVPPPVGRWAYLFYPAHLLLLVGIRSIIA